LTVRLILVERDPIRLEGISRLVRQHTRIDILGQGPDLHSALKQTYGCPAAETIVLVINLDKSDANSLPFWLSMALVLPARVDILGMTAGDRSDTLLLAYTMRLAGLVFAEAKPKEFLRAISAVSRGETYHSPVLVSKFRELLIRACDVEVVSSQGGGIRATGISAVSNIDAEYGLTNRETEITGLVRQGLTNRQIALELGISVKTVEFHVSNVLTKLGVQSRVQIAVFGAGVKQ